MILANTYFLLFVVLVLSVIALAIYRKAVAVAEDGVVHLSGGEVTAISKQTHVAQKLEKIDFWGKLMTAVAVVYGLVITAYYFYEQWQKSSQVIN